MRPPELVVKVNITKTVLPSSSEKSTKKNMLKSDKSKLKQAKLKSALSNQNTKDIELDYLNKSETTKSDHSNDQTV